MLPIFSCSLFLFCVKCGLKSFYYFSIHKPRGGLQSCLCNFVLAYIFFFCCIFTPITRQTASEPSKIIPKAISFICSPKKQITKACKCFITAYHANIVQITAIDSNVKTLGEAEPESRRRRYEQEEVIKTGNPWWHKVLILPCAWICGFHLAIFSSVWLFLRLWDTAGIRCSRLCPDITFLIYVFPTETDWRYLLICELCKWNSP